LKGLQAGGVDYISKPINPEELVARLSIHMANAQMVSEARRALDAGGRGVVALKRQGRVSWASPRAVELLGVDLSLLDRDGADALRAWIEQVAEEPVSAAAPIDLTRVAGGLVEMRAIGRSGVGDDVLARVAPKVVEAPGAILSAALGLSGREGEVLGWLANGKSNKDIAAILDLSPRTVTKHLEVIFQKMGVENRTAAAVVALRCLMM